MSTQARGTENDTKFTCIEWYLVHVNMFSLLPGAQRNEILSNPLRQLYFFWAVGAKVKLTWARWPMTQSVPKLIAQCLLRIFVTSRAVHKAHHCDILAVNCIHFCIHILEKDSFVQVKINDRRCRAVKD